MQRITEKTLNVIGSMRFIVFFLILISSKEVRASDGNSVFIIDSIHVVKLWFKQPHYWDTLMERYQSVHTMDTADVIPLLAKMSFDGKIVDSIGVKLKSGSSFEIPSNKKPLKLDFNAFVKGRSFDGLKALNLSNEFPDPTLLRNTVVFKIFREAGIIAPRTSFARVYVNDVYKGLYVLIEQVDKTYINHHFNNSSGELAKVTATSLYYLENDTSSFKRQYQFKTKNNANSWSHLIAFAKKVNETSAANFYDSLMNDFDFDSYLKVFSADIVFNNWDSYFYGQNYYLYRDSAEKKYYFLPWDYNLSLNNYEVSGGDFSILPGDKNQRLFELPLTAKIVNNKYLKKRYLDEICDMNKRISADSTINFIKKMHALLRPVLQSDTGKAMTMKQHDLSLMQEINLYDIPMAGLLFFINYRQQQILEMLKKEGVECLR